MSLSSRGLMHVAARVAVSGLALAVVIVPTDRLQSVSTIQSLVESIGGDLSTDSEILFTQNEGQWDERVLFRADAGDLTAWLCEDGVIYEVTDRVPPDPTTVSGIALNESRPGRPHIKDIPPASRHLIFKATLVGVQPEAVVGEGQYQDYHCNYFLGSDPARWRTRVPAFESVRYENIYPGIDLRFYGQSATLEYDFIVSPGADPSQIHIQYEGVESLSLTAAGDLLIETLLGQFVEKAPVVYQETVGAPSDVAAAFTLDGNNSFGFKLGEEYDPARPVIIDPVLMFSTFLGGSGRDTEPYGLALDGTGGLYVTGGTTSTDFPTHAPFQEIYAGDQDAFITKMTDDGSSILYSTYLGGSGYETGWRIEIDAVGRIYVIGDTDSPDFPTENPVQGTNGGTYDVFIAMFNHDGDTLLFSTYLGGSDWDVSGDLAIDDDGRILALGWTSSTDFPVVDPIQGANAGFEDIFVSIIGVDPEASPEFSMILKSTYLGGSLNDIGLGLDLDASGAVYIAGGSESADFPTVNPIYTHPGDFDVIAARLDQNIGSVQYATYVGGSGYDMALKCAVDPSGDMYLVGRCSSTDFPVVSPYQAANGGGSADAFLTKINSAGNALVYSTYLGGSGRDGCYGIALDIDAITHAVRPVLYGATSSTDFPTENPIQGSLADSIDAWVARFNSTGSALEFSTYHGGSGIEDDGNIVLDAVGNIYVCGETSSADFPIVSAIQPVYSGGRSDVFVTKFGESDCACDCHADPQCDGKTDVLDVVLGVNVAFRGSAPIIDPNPLCPYQNTDVNCSGFTDVIDVVKLVNVAFRGGDPAVEFCDACAS